MIPIGVEPTDIEVEHARTLLEELDLDPDSGSLTKAGQQAIVIPNEERRGCVVGWLARRILDRLSLVEADQDATLIQPTQELAAFNGKYCVSAVAWMGAQYKRPLLRSPVRKIELHSVGAPYRRVKCLPSHFGFRILV
jgi:hypothetical protein